MTRQETLVVLGILKTSYPRFYATMTKQEAENTVNLWQTMFAGEQLEEVKLALYKLISTCEFPPTIAQLRKALSSIREKEIPVDGEAWGEVIAAIRRFGYPQEALALESMSSITRQAVKCIGWSYLCQSEDQMSDRAHFLKIYKSLADREKEDRFLPADVRVQIARNRDRLEVKSLGEVLKEIGVDVAR